MCFVLGHTSREFSRRRLLPTEEPEHFVLGHGVKRNPPGGVAESMVDTPLDRFVWRTVSLAAREQCKLHGWIDQLVFSTWRTDALNDAS